MSEANRLKIERVVTETVDICGTSTDTQRKVDQTYKAVQSTEEQVRSIHDTVTATEERLGRVENAVKSISQIELGVHALVAENKDIMSTVTKGLHGSTGSSTPTLSTGLHLLDERLRQIELSLLTLISTRDSLNISPVTTPPSATLQQETNDLQAGVLQKPAVLELACSAVESKIQTAVTRRHHKWLRECFCHHRHHNNTREYVFRPFHFSSVATDIAKHSRNCRFWNASAESHSKELTFAFFASVLGSMVQATLGISQGAGGLSIYPRLNFRPPIRRSNSPVFRFCDYEIYEHEDDLEN